MMGIRWTGFLIPSFSEEYTLSLELDGSGLVSLDRKILFRPTAGVPTKLEVYEPLTKGVAYAIVVEYQRGTLASSSSGYIFLKWQSRSQQEEIISPSALYPRGEEIFPRSVVTAA